MPAAHHLFGQVFMFQNVIWAVSSDVLKLVSFIRTANMNAIDFLVEFMSDRNVFSVEPWSESGDGNYALRINLAGCQYPGREGLIPFPWSGNDQPTVYDAIGTIRTLTCHRKP